LPTGRLGAMFGVPNVGLSGSDQIADRMIEGNLLTVGAVLALLPASFLVFRKPVLPDAVFWSTLMLAVAGPTAVSVDMLSDGWRSDLVASLWITIAASLVLYAVIAVLAKEAWRLAPLIASYMLVLAVLAVIWFYFAPAKASGTGASVWVGLHIAISVFTYGLVTIAAVAAFAAFYQERELKRKRVSNLTKNLPSVSDCDGLVVRTLAVGEVVLGLGMFSGIASQFSGDGTFIDVNHKSILTVMAFVVIGLLLYAHYKTGLRGRKAARYVLLAYLLLTLGYPGVKFVTDVLLT